MEFISRRLHLLYGVLVAALLVGVGYFSIMRNTAKAAVPSYDFSSVTFDENTYPAVVLGGGVGGLTAGTYLSMANIPTLLAEGETAGGLLTQSLSVRNWPGELDAPGATITEKVRTQAETRGVDIVQEKATAVNVKKWPFQVTLQDIHDPKKTRTISALSLVVGIGAHSNYLKIPGETEYWGRGVTNCAVCEGSLYKDKVVCVVGGGDSAIEEVHYLSSIAKKVYVFVRRDKLRAVDNRKDEVAKLDNVEFVFNTSPITVKGDGKKVTAVRVVDNKTKEERDVAMDGIFLAIGFTPNTKLFEGQLSLTKGKYIRLVDDQETSIPGVYAVGDIVDPVYKQAVTAAGDGCRAALQAQRFLSDLGYHAKPHQVEDHPEKADGHDSHAAIEEAKTKDPVKEAAEEKPAEKEEPAATSSELPKAGIVHEVTSVAEYEKLLAQTERPVVIDFYATWCGPCKQIAPLYKKVAEAQQDALFLKVNIDPLPEIAQRHNIYGVPTFLFVKGGKEQERVVGGMSEGQFTSKTKALL